ncbi:VOC family protein [bacterium]|nr:VOC family protein [bacterium]
MNHSLCYIEFYTKNLARATKFYTEIFAWKFQPMGDCYAMFNAEKDGIGGGFAQIEEGTEVKNGNSVIPYISVENIGEMLAKIEANGGKMVFPETKISDEHGYFAHFEDTEGNTVGIWRP